MWDVIHTLDGICKLKVMSESGSSGQDDAARAADSLVSVQDSIEPEGLYTMVGKASLFC